MVHSAEFRLLLTIVIVAINALPATAAPISATQILPREPSARIYKTAIDLIGKTIPLPSLPDERKWKVHQPPNIPRPVIQKPVTPVALPPVLTTSAPQALRDLKASNSAVIAKVAGQKRELEDELELEGRDLEHDNDLLEHSFDNAGSDLD